MVKNTVTVYIDGINRTAKAVTPIKMAELLDERLDECTLSLRNIKKKTFSPMTPVEIVIQNEVYYGKYKLENVVYFREETKYFLIADDAATESILGKGLYNHDLALIEVTKAAELVVVDTITYTNDIGRNYAGNSALAEPIFD